VVWTTSICRRRISRVIRPTAGIHPAAYATQRDAARRRIAGELPEDLLILVQHPPVVTLGRSTKPGHLLSTPEQLGAHGVALRDIERGGDVTVHEPAPLLGQNPGENPILAAMRQAWRNFVGFIAWLIASLGVLIPVGAILVVGWYGYRRFRARAK
jgi:lipoate-protein ligase B